MVALISVSALFGSCQKEQQELTRLNLIAEGFQNNKATKLAVDGLASYWVDGEKVYINDNSDVTISYSGGTSASASGTFTTPIRAIYPASICSSALTASSATVTLPAEYQYKQSGGMQLLETPMAAYSASGDKVLFKHLTGALTVALTNKTGKPMFIDKITVSSSKYQLSGSWTVDFTALEGTGSPVATATAADRSVAMTFRDEAVSLDASATGYYQIPVPPVGDDHDFTVTVTYYNEDHTDLITKQCYTRTQSQTSGSGHALQRAELGYVPVDAETSGSGITADWMPKEGAYYLISSLFHLRTIATHTTSTYSELDYAKFKVVRDFDASSSTYSDFTRIYNCPEFDGQGHTISNLRINSLDSYCGMFRVAKNIKNLTLYNPKLLVNTNAFYIGPLVSAYNMDLIISNCTITNPTVEIKTNLTSSTHQIGGMVGECRGLTMTNCRVTNFNMYYNGGAIQSSLCFGGMLGYSINKASYAVKMENCYFSSNATFTAGATLTFGGLLGGVESGEVTYFRPKDCTVSCNANLNINSTYTAYNFYVGSLVGYDPSSASNNIAGTATIYTGNSTSGTITTAYTGSKSGTKYIGDATNKQVCGNTNVMYPNNQEVDDLNLTIE